MLMHRKNNFLFSNGHELISAKWYCSLKTEQLKKDTKPFALRWQYVSRLELFESRFKTISFHH